jgi:hypothetical protein
VALEQSIFENMNQQDEDEGSDDHDGGDPVITNVRLLILVLRLLSC